MTTARTAHRATRPAAFPAALVITLTAALAGCGARPPACVAERPEWTARLESTADTWLAAAPGRSTGGEGLARERAAFAVRAALAQQLETEVSDLSDRLVEDLGIDADLGKARDYRRSVSRQYSSQALNDSEVVEYWLDPCAPATTVWARARLPRDRAPGLLDRAAREGLRLLDLSEERLDRAMEFLERERSKHATP